MDEFKAMKKLNIITSNNIPKTSLEYKELIKFVDVSDSMLFKVVHFIDK